MAKIKEYYPKPLMLTHDLIGGKWKLRILWHIIHGNNRFSTILRGIPEISQKVLASQLKELEESELIYKIIVEERPPKVIEYKINHDEISLCKLVEQICDFTRSYAIEKNIQFKD